MIFEIITKDFYYIKFVLRLYMLNRIEKLVEYSNDIKVLYVESHPISREYTSDFLSKIFNNLIVAEDAEDGFEKFQKNDINLIITDTMMPKLSGIKMIEKIKNLNKNCYTIILSQDNKSNILLKSIKLNIDAYILKPINFDDMLDSIEKIIEKIKLENELKSHQFYLEQYLNLIDKSSIISKTDTNGIITYVSDSFCEISGYKNEELLGYKHNITRHHENPDELYQNLWHTIKTKEQIWEGVIKNKSKDGTSYYVKTIITPIKNVKGEIVEYITVRNNLNAVIDDKKYLFNKIEENKLSILILLQIDEFDILEKFYNIVTIDQVEKNFAYNLMSYLPKEYAFENVCSLGNGRFALLTTFSDFEKTKLNIEKYLNNFVTNVKNSSLKFDDMEFDLNITVSYSTGKHMIYEDCQTGLENALREKINLNFSNDSSIVSSREAEENLKMIRTVKIALDNYKIVSYFQPIINNKTKKIEKYESLVRLIDEDGSVLSPFHFLNISKKGNYYSKITQRVLENSFKILHSIKTKLSINISASDIEKEEIRTQIFELLKQYPEDCHRIIFELLEDEKIKDFQKIKNFIFDVKSMGVRIAIDDFGAGYSNFERIYGFEPDIIKIDGSLIKHIATDLFSRNIVEAIVVFAKKQNIETIAEFVENESIYNILNEIGVDYSQGYYFGKPESF